MVVVVEVVEVVVVDVDDVVLDVVVDGGGSVVDVVDGAVERGVVVDGRRGDVVDVEPLDTITVTGSFVGWSPGPGDVRTTRPAAC